MSRYIDAERLKQFLKPREWGTPDERWVPEHEIGAMLDYFPAADVAEVVRCKDCMFWRRDRISCEGYAMCKTGEGGIRFRRENDYCSVARRRTDER